MKSLNAKAILERPSEMEILRDTINTTLDLGTSAFPMLPKPLTTLMHGDQEKNECYLLAYIDMAIGHR